MTPYHHGDLRAELLRHALRRLEETGAAGLSLRELARAAGVSHAAPRQHFRDKQALLDALAVSGLERLGGELDAAISGASFEERLTQFAQAYVGFAVENPALLALMFARKDELRAANEAAFAAPRAMVDHAVADGEIAGGDEVEMAILATIHGLAAIIGTGMIGERSPDAVVAGTVEVLARGLRATPAPARSAAAGAS